MSVLEHIAKGRAECLRDNEEPRDVLVNVALKHVLLREVTPMYLYQFVDGHVERLMGMNIEWVNGPTPVSIRTKKGDVRRVDM